METIQLMFCICKFRAFSYTYLLKCIFLYQKKFLFICFSAGFLSSIAGGRSSGAKLATSLQQGLPVARFHRHVHGGWTTMSQNSPCLSICKMHVTVKPKVHNKMP